MTRTIRRTRVATRAATATPPLRLVRSRSLAAQIADSIVEGIALGELLPGQRLIETELAAGMKVSRIPVREAIKALDAQGIVTATPHRGARVVASDARALADIREVRIGLETIAARRAAESYARDPAGLARLDRIVERIAAAGARRDWSEANRADIAFHRELCVASGSEVLLTVWETLARHIRIIFAHETWGLTDAGALVREHLDLRAALLAGNPARLEREIRTHVLGRAGARQPREAKRRSRRQPSP